MWRHGVLWEWIFVVASLGEGDVAFVWAELMFVVRVSYWSWDGFWWGRLWSIKGLVGLVGVRDGGIKVWICYRFEVGWDGDHFGICLLVVYSSLIRNIKWAQRCVCWCVCVGGVISFGFILACLPSCASKFAQSVEALALILILAQGNLQSGRPNMRDIGIDN